MKGLHTVVVGDAHSYTRSRTPWVMAVPNSAYGKLIRYISGGGMQAFGRTIRQEEISLRHRRFWRAAAAFALLWLLCWVF